LVPMDVHCANITLGLYQQSGKYLIHTYRGLPEAAQRVQFLHGAAAVLGGLEWDGTYLAFRCGTVHRAAMGRVLLESAKLATGAEVSPRPLVVFDKKLNREVGVSSCGAGRYQVTAPGDDAASRIEAIAAGLKKLAELEDAGGHTVR